MTKEYFESRSIAKLDNGYTDIVENCFENLNEESLQLHKDPFLKGVYFESFLTIIFQS